MNRINSNKSTTYYAIAGLTALTIAAITATVFIGMHHWQIARVRQSISTFFSKNLAIKAAVVSIVATSVLLLPLGAAALLSYKSARLKYDKAHTELVKEVIRHNGSLISRFKGEPKLADLLEPITQMMIDDRATDPVKVLRKLSTLSLEMECEDDIPEDEAKYYLDITEPKGGAPLQLYCSKGVNTLLAVVDNLIGAIGIADLFVSTENGMQASVKAQKILMLVSILNILASILIPTVGVKMAGIIIGSSLGGLTLLSILWPLIKPIPTQLPGNSINLTNEALAKRIPSSDARQDICNQLATALLNGKHAMLIGPSRTGKTQALRSFVEKITKGEYPELKGKIAFYWNTADLVAHQASTLMGGTSNPLTAIADNLANARNMKKVIFCFDEFHSAMSKESFPEQMKTAFEIDGPFKHVIGITTTKEFKELIAPNTALVNRFELIPVENMDESSTLKVLNDAILQNPNMPLREEDVLSHIIEQSTDHTTPGNTPQPHTASNILTACIDALDGDVMGQLQTEITKLDNQVSAILGEAITSGSKITKENKEKIAALRTDLSKKKQTLKVNQAKKADIARAKQLLKQIRGERYKTALKVSKLDKKEKMLKYYTVLEAFEESVVKKIKDDSGSLGIKAMITRRLVDEVLEKRRVTA